MKISFRLIVLVLMVSISVLCEINSTENENQEEGEEEKEEGLVHLDSLFRKYAQTNTTMYSYQLKIFLKQFFNSIINYQSQANKSSPADLTKQNCVKSKANSFLNIASHLNDEILINVTNFNKLSSLLVSNLDVCLNSAPALSIRNNNLTNSRSVFDSVSFDFEQVKQRVLSLPLEVWIYSLVSVAIISFAGLVLVLIVPLLNLCCFDYIYQFLIAIALGTLCGDALLHLIPHAFLDKMHEFKLVDNVSFKGSHENVFKGLGLVAGIYLFFLIESIMHMIQSKKIKKAEDLRKQLVEKKSRKKSPHRKRHGSSNRAAVELENSRMQSANLLLESTKRANIYIDDEHQSDYDNFLVPYDNAEVNETKKHHRKSKTNPPDYEEIYLKGGNSSDKKNHKDKKLRKYEVNHCHDHSYSNSSVLMVMLGDGLHNFSDGLAIGVAFVISLTAGIGTAIAVFFHELPHEIGDFSILIKNKYSLKRAICLNITSSILCFLGLGVGLTFGSFKVVSDWSFLMIAGTFIYISLVDIIPELYKFNKNGSFIIFFIQNIGILSGFGLMLAISFYEKQLTKLIKF